MGEPNNAMVHFYRAAVVHADVWRQRTDATTNWTVVSTAALITFTFSTAENPHFILLVGFALDTFFLVMESRRYQIFQRWRKHVHDLHRWVIAPSLAPGIAPSEREIEAGLERLARELGNTTPRISLLDAMGYRTRRNYGFVFVLVLTTWLLKLWYHPVPAASFDEVVIRAAVGVVSGGVVMTTVFVISFFLAYLAMTAPSERMENWEELGSPLRRMVRDAREKIPDYDDLLDAVETEASHQRSTIRAEGDEEGAPEG